MEENQDTLTYTFPSDFQYEDKIIFSPGANFGERYRIIEEIGRGGMGRVYKGEDKQLDITVALKLIRPKYSSDPRFIERFKKETLIARSISHENVIRIYDLGEANEIKYISMEYIKGQNLKELIRTSGSLTIEKTIDITRQICKALKAAHQHGIIHRDLKPQNIMIDTNGKVHVMDFGLAKSIYVPDKEKSGSISGTPRYLSSEQARGEKLDQRSDIYSLGLIIYEMLTGNPTFDATDASGFIQKHIHEKPPNLSEFNPNVPYFLEKIVLKCLEKDRDKRYQNIDELLTDIEKKDAITPPYKTSPIRKMLYATLPIVLILCILLGIFLLKWKKKPTISSQERDKIRIAVMYFENNTGDKSLDHWRRSLQDLLITDLHQSIYMHILPNDRLIQILEAMNQVETKQYSSKIFNKITKEENIDYYILASYTKTENKFLITCKIREAQSGEIIDTKIAEGKDESSLIETLDQLTPWIKTRFNLSRLEIADDIDKKIGEILSNSPEALKFYYEAEELFRKRDFSQCIMVLEEAVEIDPEFAMAYRMIAKCYAVKNDPEKVKQNLSKALEFLYRLSDRERYLIQASYMSWVEKYNVKAIRIYQELLNIYPDDETANILLADIYRYFEEWDLAIQLFEKVLDINKKSVDAISKLPFVYLAKGLYDKTQNLLQANKKIFSNQAFYHKNLCHLFLCQGNYELALSEIEKAIHLEPENYSHLIFEGIIYQSKENFEQAEKIYKKLLENKNPAAQLQARLLLGELYLLQGKYRKSKKEIIQSISSPRNIYSKNLHLLLLLLLVYFDLRENLDAETYDFINQAMEVVFKTDLIDMQKIVLHYRGLVLLKMNNIEMAKKTSHQLKELIAETGNKKNMRFYYHLMGMISLHNEQVPEAIEYFEKAVSLLSFQVFTLSNHSFYFDSLAFAYDKKGDIEKAREFYEKIIELPLGKLQFGDIYAKSYYLLGKIYQKKDWKEKAIENYKNFLHLWKDADTSLPEVVNAEKQLAILKDNTQK